MKRRDSPARARLLHAALRQFADRGYAGASVQSIVDAAHVTKPTLYYHFHSKAGLFQALLDWAHDERYRLMREALTNGVPLKEQLTEILAALFEFIPHHRPLMRIAFATAFAARGEIPAHIQYLEKPQRNFNFIQRLIRQGRVRGGLLPGYSTRELALGIWGLMTIRVMDDLVTGQRLLTRRDAETVVRLSLGGAARRAA